MTRDDIKNIVSIKALSYGLDPKLAQSIAQIESSFNPMCMRFEPNWMYYYMPLVYSKNLGVTLATERTLQQISYGLMQVMGSVARELGFEEELIKLCDPDLGAQYGCMKLVDIKKKYSDEQDIISAYNAGTPSKIGIKYRNQDYVNKVTEALLKLRSLS